MTPIVYDTFLSLVEIHIKFVCVPSQLEDGHQCADDCGTAQREMDYCMHLLRPHIHVLSVMLLNTHVVCFYKYLLQWGPIHGGQY